MARTTNEDTLMYVDSRYELGMLASQRVRSLNGGTEPIVKKRNDKLTIVALREIATGNLDMDEIRHEFIQSYKDSPLSSQTDISLEVKSEDPTLRDIDAELDSILMDDAFTDSATEEDSSTEAEEVVAELEAPADSKDK